MLLLLVVLWVLGWVWERVVCECVVVFKLVLFISFILRFLSGTEEEERRVFCLICCSSCSAACF